MRSARLLSRLLQAARYSAGRAQRQFDAADPQNRLVTDELERRWNQALQRVHEIEQRIAQHRGRVSGYSPYRRWRNFPPSQIGSRSFGSTRTPTSVCESASYARSSMRSSSMSTRAASEIVLLIHWKGGLHTEVRVPRRRRGQNRMHTSPETKIDVVRSLVRICPDDLIASFLNRNGLRTGRGSHWTRERVTALRSHHDIPVYCAERRTREGWLNLTEAARTIGVCARTLRLAVEQGELTAAHPLPDGPWIFNRAELQSEKAAKLVWHGCAPVSAPIRPAV